MVLLGLCSGDGFLVKVSKKTVLRLRSARRLATVYHEVYRSESRQHDLHLTGRVSTAANALLGPRIRRVAKQPIVQKCLEPWSIDAPPSRSMMCPTRSRGVACVDTPALIETERYDDWSDQSRLRFRFLPGIRSRKLGIYISFPALAKRGRYRSTSRFGYGRQTFGPPHNWVPSHRLQKGRDNASTFAALDHPHDSPSILHPSLYRFCY